MVGPLKPLEKDSPRTLLVAEVANEVMVRINALLTAKSSPAGAFKIVFGEKDITYDFTGMKAALSGLLSDIDNLKGTDGPAGPAGPGGTVTTTDLVNKINQIISALGNPTLSITCDAGGRGVSGTLVYDVPSPL